MNDVVSMFGAGQRDAAHADRVNVHFWFKELLLTYKFGEKYRYQKALNILRPYLDDRLLAVFEDIETNSLWTNPITGKKGY